MKHVFHKLYSYDAYDGQNIFGDSHIYISKEKAISKASELVLTLEPCLPHIFAQQMTVFASELGQDKSHKVVYGKPFVFVENDAVCAKYPVTVQIFDVVEDVIPEIKEEGKPYRARLVDRKLVLVSEEECWFHEPRSRMDSCRVAVGKNNIRPFVSYEQASTTMRIYVEELVIETQD